jgi:hypothetical protein
MKLIETALEFNNAYRIQVEEVPTMPSRIECVHMQMLIQKQIEDINAAWYSNSIEDVSMAIAHCIYTLAVTSCRFGIHKKLAEKLTIIHVANMGNVNRLSVGIKPSSTFEFLSPVHRLEIVV